MPDTQRELIGNVDRLNRLMDQHGWGAVVVRSGKNFTYLAGFAYPGTLGRHLDFPDSPREVLLVWPGVTVGSRGLRSTTTMPNPPTRWRRTS